MFPIIGAVIVVGSVLGGYMPHGDLRILFQPFEVLHPHALPAAARRLAGGGEPLPQAAQTRRRPGRARFIAA